MDCNWMKDAIVPALAVLMTTGGLIMIYANPDVKTEIIALMTLVLSFYFGSSKGSADKNETISKLSKPE